MVTHLFNCKNRFVVRAIYSIYIAAITVTLLFPFANKSPAEETLRFERLWPALKQPWYFLHPLAVTIDNDDYVYVADTDNHRIRKLTGNGQFITEWGKKGESEGEFNRPTGITSDRDGFIYVVDANNHRIQKFNADGLFLQEWGGQGSGDGEFDKPFDIIADGLGFLYVTDTGNRRIQKITGDGQFVDSWSGYTDDDPQRCAPLGIAADGAGHIYVADNNNDRIQKFTTKGQLVLEWGVEGDGDGQFYDPDGVAVDGEGFVYVTDLFNHRIQKFTPQGDFVAKWGSVGSGDGQFRNPVGMAADEKGYLYVADKENSRIQRFFTNGRLAEIWGNSAGDGEFNLPSGIGIHEKKDDENGVVYVADTDNHLIQKFDLSGGFITQWGKEGIAEGELYYPNGVDVDSEGRVWVANTGNDRIDIFSADGVYERSIANTAEKGPLFSPYDLAITSDGVVYVLDSGNHRILKLKPKGELVDSWGGEGTEPGKFDVPRGIAVDANGIVYVADTRNHRVQKLDVTCEWLTWGAQGDGQNEFEYPIGIAIDTDGNVYVADTQNHRIRKFDANGKLVSGAGLLGSDPGQMRYPGALAVSKEANIYIADTDNHRIQVFLQAEAGARNKAIIVAGGGPYPGNHLWPATQAAAHFAYRTLTYQGFDKSTIFYLNPETDLDLDNNGVADDVDGDATNARLETAITQWAADAENVVLFLTDHGKAGSFRMSASETLAADDLAVWLDSLAGSVSGRIVVIYDACNAGSFLPILAGPDRIIITSTDIDEDAWFVGQGAISFSGFFWTHVFSGLDLAEAFSLAKTSLGAATDGQHPLLDGDGDGAANEDADRVAAKGVYVVGAALYAGSGPQIIQTVGDLRLSGTTEADLHLVATDDRGISRTWGVIQPPGYGSADGEDTVLDLPTVALLPVGNDRFEGGWDGFDAADGAYRVTFCVRDADGNTAVSDPITVETGETPSRRALIVVGAVDDDRDEAMSLVSKLAHDALIRQGYGEGAIQTLAPEAPDHPADRSTLEAELASWANHTAPESVVYLVGSAADGAFRLAGPDRLSPADLDLWLDRIPGTVTVICDFDGAGRFLSALLPPTGTDRVVMASSPADGRATFASAGAVSFSAFFWRAVAEGMSVGRSFETAARALSLLVGDAAGPLLDDTGDGIGNARNDGRLADGMVLGAGIRLTADAPQVGGAVSDGSTYGPGVPVPIAAEGISTSVELDGVWAVVTPPGEGTGIETNPPVTVALKPSSDGRYTGVWPGGDQFGDYRVAVFAEDVQGNVSLARETVIRIDGGDDVYEPDDTRSGAGIIVINAPAAQHHNLSAGDVDWVSFYGTEGGPYTVELISHDLGGDLSVILYGPDDAVLDETVASPGSDRVTLTPPVGREGIYRIRVAPVDPASWTPGGGYFLGVTVEVGAFAGFVRGQVIHAVTGEPVAGARIRTAAGGSAITRPNGAYLLIDAPGTLDVSITCDGYLAEAGRIQVAEGGTTVGDFVLTPLVPINRFPVAEILHPADDLTVSAGESVDFIGASSDGDPPLTYSWDFGGGADAVFAVSPGPVTFETPGTYTVTFSVTDADGDSAVDAVAVAVVPADTEPTASIESPADGTTLAPGEAVEFLGAVTGGNPPFSYRWDFGGGGPSVDLADPGPVVFETPGVYEITFSVTDTDGDGSSASVTLTVKAPTPGPGPDAVPDVAIVSPETDVTMTAGDSLRFVGTASGGDPPLAFSWDFSGAAAPSDGAIPGEVRFDAPGTYPVSLTVTDADGDTDIVRVTVTVIEPVSPPELAPTPVITDPTGAGEPTSLTPRFEINLEDIPPGFIHSETRWQIAADPEFAEVVFDVSSDVYLTALPVPALVLVPETAYLIRVRIIGEGGEPGDWSDPLPFFTPETDAPDTDGDGVPDGQAIGPEADTDRNGVPDIGQDDLACVETPGGAVCVMNQTDGAGIETLRAIEPADVADGALIPGGMIHGLLGLRLISDTPGGAVELTVFLADAVPSGSGWIGHDALTGWYDAGGRATLALDNRSVTLTPIDGGPADADGTENGVIVHLGGPGIPDLRTLSVAGPEPDSVGGSGCFVESGDDRLAASPDPPLNFKTECPGCPAAFSETGSPRRPRMPFFCFGISANCDKRTLSAPGRFKSSTLFHESERHHDTYQPGSSGNGGGGPLCLHPDGRWFRPGGSVRAAGGDPRVVQPGGLRGPGPRDGRGVYRGGR